jgi:hypothetical protein
MVLFIEGLFTPDNSISDKGQWLESNKQLFLLKKMKLTLPHRG